MRAEMVRGVAPTITGQHNANISDYTAVAVFRMEAFGRYSEGGAKLRFESKGL